MTPSSGLWKVQDEGHGILTMLRAAFSITEDRLSLCAPMAEVTNKLP